MTESPVLMKMFECAAWGHDAELPSDGAAALPLCLLSHVTVAHPL
jgi:hypothetical protein